MGQFRVSRQSEAQHVVWITEKGRRGAYLSLGQHIHTLSVSHPQRSTGVESLRLSQRGSLTTLSLPPFNDTLAPALVCPGVEGVSALETLFNGEILRRRVGVVRYPYFTRDANRGFPEGSRRQETVCLLQVQRWAIHNSSLWVRNGPCPFYIFDRRLGQGVLVADGAILAHPDLQKL